MSNTAKKILLFILSLLLVVELGFAGVLYVRSNVDESLLKPTEEPTGAPTEEPTEAPTEAPTEPPTEAPTDPPPVSYTLSFVGDCTLGSYPEKWYTSSGFIETIGENYDYPFANVREYFEKDDLTLANLEVVFADSGYAVSKRFTFRGPTAYTQILTGSSVEAVTLANNHAKDYGKAGYETTKQVLTEAEVAYVEDYSSTMITLENGLVVGLYAMDYVSGINLDKAVAGVKQLKEDGAELIVVAAHWGFEGKYRPVNNQKDGAKALIDAGANIIWGHHPHVLQPIEEYNGGIIYYSLGNFSFGGNRNPKDKDSVIVQQEVIRAHDGTVTLGQLTLIPCSVSSIADSNNYQPTPCEEGSEMYNRILSKLDGTYEGADMKVDYSVLDS